MSWMATLYKTYEQALELDLPEDEKLMPISHTRQNAHINVVIDGVGNFLRASVLEKTQVVLPATEKSAGRTSGEAPYPLADKLQYTAGDYASYGGLKKPYFESYKAQLGSWAESDCSHPHIRAVRDYIEKSRLIQDLIESGICHIGENGHLLTHWPTDSPKEEPPLFKLLPKKKDEIDKINKLDQGNALICWSVQIPGDVMPDTWKNPDIQQCWVNYDAQSAGDTALCFVSGEQQPVATNHPAKLRHTGDKAKLISSNDKDGYTFRGRFAEAEQAANVGFEVTQKAHNALRWLIGERKQAYRNGDQVVVIWAISGKKTPSPFAELPLSFDEPFELNDNESVDNTDLDAEPDISVGLGQQHGIALQRYMKGYYQNFEDTPNESVIIMGLDSATTGRMAITYYRDFMAMDYLDMTNRWYQHLAWPQRVVKEYINSKGKKYTKVRWWPGTPTPDTIFTSCYGDKSNDSLKKQVTERLLPCIVENKPIPEDLLRLAARRASNPNSGEQWEWERNLGVACALYRGFHHPDRQPDPTQQRNYDMALDLENTSRDYLFGRLLAIADKIERVALSLRDENRPTASQRLMQRFADRPSSTWENIDKQLTPYRLQLQVSRTGFLVNREKELDAIIDSFQPDDFTSDAPLSAEYLLGFHSQRLALRPSEQQADKPTDESTDSSTQED